MSKAFWLGVREGMNPMWLLSWLLYWMGHIISLPMYRWDGFAWLYPAYNNLMHWSWCVQDRFGLSSPWEKME